MVISVQNFLNKFRVDIEEFKNGVYSDGEIVKFKAKVISSNLIQTSYGNATVVEFEKIDTPFCFIGDYTWKYKEGKDCITEVKFHEYQVDNIKRVYIEELILGWYLSIEEVLQGVSFWGGLGLLGNDQGENDDTFDLQVNSIRYNKTYSLKYYDTSLNKIASSNNFKDNMKDLEEGKYPFKDSDTNFFMEEFLAFVDYECIELMKLSNCDYNCTEQKNDESYLPDRIDIIDNDGDGNLSIEDTFQIELEPTPDKYTFNYYSFNVGGITSGTNVILNWYNGPFFTPEHMPFYTLGLVKEEISAGDYSHIIPIDECYGDPLNISEINIYLTEAGRAPKRISHENIYDGMNIPLEDIGDSFSGATFSINDMDQNNFLDSGDYFRINNLEKNCAYEFMVKDNKFTWMMECSFLVSHGMNDGNYPILVMSAPDYSEGNITINVTNINERFPHFQILSIVLTTPEREIKLRPSGGVTERYSEDHMVRLAINDSDNNRYLTKNDSIEINGLNASTFFSLRVMLFDFKIYEINGTAHLE